MQSLLTGKFLLKVMTVLLFFSFTATAHQGATGVTKERMDKFMQMKHDLRASFDEAKNGHFDIVIRKSRQMAEWGRVMPQFFPEGSGRPPSEASQTIWQDFDDFTLHGLQMTKAAEDVIIAAENKDTDAVITALKGVSQTCSACHRQFRKQ